MHVIGKIKALFALVEDGAAAEGQGQQ